MVAFMLEVGACLATSQALLSLQTTRPLRLMLP